MGILKYLWERRTTALGYVVLVLGVLATSDLFSAQTIKWFMLISGTVTAVLGHYNNSRIKAQVRDTEEQEEQQ